MPINSVRIKNLTIFDDLEIGLSPGSNIFIGQNGTGKTHLLKAVYGACEVSREESHIIFGDYFQGISNSLNLFHDKSVQNLDICLMDNNEETEKIFHHCPFDLKFGDHKEIPCGDTVQFHLPFSAAYDAVFIPGKDMLTHANGLLAMKEKYRRFPFDKTLTDIITKASQWTVKQIPEIAASIVPLLEEIMEGEVMLENDEFFIKKRNGKKINFAVEAEGIKKIGLLWCLLMNENITEHSILLWDEPEANLNPEYLPVMVEILLELSRHNVQILVSSHNYIFAKYFDVKQREGDKVLFHALYRADKTVKCETENHFSDLNHNEITHTFDRLLDEVYDFNVGE